MKRIVFIVSRNHPELVERLQRQCRGTEVEIVVDRRVGERRRHPEPLEFADRRRRDRRVNRHSPDLELIGMAVAVVP